MELAAAGTVGLQYAVEGESKWGVFENAPSSFLPSFLPSSLGPLAAEFFQLIALLQLLFFLPNCCEHP